MKNINKFFAFFIVAVILIIPILSTFSLPSAILIDQGDIEWDSVSSANIVDGTIAVQSFSATQTNIVHVEIQATSYIAGNFTFYITTAYNFAVPTPEITLTSLNFTHPGDSINKWHLINITDIEITTGTKYIVICGHSGQFTWWSDINEYIGSTFVNSDFRENRDFHFRTYYNSEGISEIKIPIFVLVITYSILALTILKNVRKNEK